MVRILSNGDIVQDDDPRIKRNSGQSSSSGQRRGFVQHNDNPYQQGAGGVQTVSIFEVMNQKLLDAGLPRFNLGPYTVEPIATVGMILAGLMFGLPGLVFGALLFIVVKVSNGQGNQGGQEGAGRAMRRGFQGGHTLGR
ncbi:uncharacterized protein FAM241B [Lingula anatina]|uniref:Uncharacterized protein FAM241B n=1 Tax=Lingula anatina TaxID=7574 RepID=A0A1S3JIQ5_LINAN|nr:uncharacterized protein FAM241B [Lingula anatina]|eukprot:XP_013409784.1 uncharacterized protein FAM241B [Lingula anatina]